MTKISLIRVSPKSHSLRVQKYASSFKNISRRTTVDEETLRLYSVIKARPQMLSLVRKPWGIIAQMLLEEKTA